MDESRNQQQVENSHQYVEIKQHTHKQPMGWGKKP